jgi:pimeloyl-ACP methyl ester carboxylesterase
MNTTQPIFKRQTRSIRFKNADMDFMLNWMIGITQIIGMSPAQVLAAVHGVRDGDPIGWRIGFCTAAHDQLDRAKAASAAGETVLAAEAYLGAAYALRAALHFTPPKTPDFDQQVTGMEQAFQQGVDLLGVPVRPIEVPFETTTLPGYYLEQDRTLRPTILMIGGGDTFREDLFYFAGYPGWKRGYNVLMVDLPGQGKTPDRGLNFRTDMDAPIHTLLDWLQTNAAGTPGQVALYGVSGGGYFTTLAAADPRISAWIAATPIFDMAAVYRDELAGVLGAPGWLVEAGLRLTGALNKIAEVSLAKYAWQFGTRDFKTAFAGVLEQARTADYAAITCPSLFLVSEGEGPELKRQTRVVAADLARRGIDVTVRDFTAADGADAHCQLNNLRLAHTVIFDWLDRVFAHAPEDIRLRV